MTAGHVAAFDEAVIAKTEAMHLYQSSMTEENGAAYDVASKAVDAAAERLIAASLTRGLAQSAAGETVDLGDFSEWLHVEPCAKCGKPITWDALWYHTDSGLPPCDPSRVDPDAYSDIEGDKYDIATPKEGV